MQTKSEKRKEKHPVPGALHELIKYLGFCLVQRLPDAVEISKLILKLFFTIFVLE